MKENIKINLLNILALMSLFVIILLAYFTWGWADDFSNSNVLREKTPLQFAINIFNNWDGRGLTQGLILGIFLKYLPFQVINMIWAISFVGSAFLIGEILSLEIPSLKNNKILRTAIIAVALWVGFIPHISETVYWSTGGYYIFAGALGLVWTYEFIKFQKNKSNFNFKKNFPFLLLLFFLSIVIGMLTHNLSTGLLALGAALLFSTYLKEQTGKLSFWMNSTATMGVFVGLLIISFAPGNFIRSKAGAHSFSNDPIYLISSIREGLNYYLNLSNFLILFGLFSTVLLIYLAYYKSRELKKVFNIELKSKITLQLDKTVWANLFFRLKFLIAALGTLIPFIAVPDFRNPRTSIYFMIFLLIFIFSFLIQFISNRFLVLKSDSLSNKRISFFFFLPTVGFLILFLSLIYSHINQTRFILKQVDARKTLLQKESSKGRDIIVEPIVGTIPFSIRFNDVSPDPDYWINYNVAKYYNLKSIKLKSE